MWFLTTSTAFSAREVPGLLHPGTERGSRRFRCVDTAAIPLSEESVTTEPSNALSRRALRTPRRSPPAGSRIASLRPLPPRCCASRRRLCRNRDCASDPHPRGFAPPSGVVRDQAVASRTAPSPSMGFVPLQGADQARVTNPVCLHTSLFLSVPAGLPPVLPPSAPADFAASCRTRFPWLRPANIPPAGCPLVLPRSGVGSESVRSRPCAASSAAPFTEVRALRAATADLLGVCDVKDQMTCPPKRANQPAFGRFIG
jgi:hypothetical protein